MGVRTVFFADLERTLADFVNGEESEVYSALRRRVFKADYSQRDPAWLGMG